MNNKILQILLSLIDQLPPSARRAIIDMVLDFIEDYVKDSPSTWDNMVAMPIISALRSWLNVPDND